MMHLDFLFENTLLLNFLSTCLIGISLIVVRALFLKALQQTVQFDHEDHRRAWVVNTRTLFLLLFVLLAICIWASEIRNLALSLATIAVAMVIASKEVIICIAGAFYRGMGRSFSIGNVIEINGSRGKVIDQTFLSTKILEIGPGPHLHHFTGRIITIPNAQFLTHSVINECFSEEFTLAVIEVNLPADANWQKAERSLVESALKEISPYLHHAKSELLKVQKTLWIDPPSLEPKVFLSFKQHDKIELKLRCAVPCNRKGKVEQAILRSFWNLYKKEGEIKEIKKDD
ncbi:MAG: MscS Mechanosensitive ion channel [Chlamydiales bacterium]|jgi:small-conductance mechanosensitive channel|nr:MscS Mechanosensitive ion channel [Chlamydiales bacterium]